ncbi:MAG: fused MFS/spermidine synthase, partial [Thermoanaerobaculaceae bacterium]|nr:fused MFS/spermidine synthase [Thermoanaerobaculaceae bacterium]
MTRRGSWLALGFVFFLSGAAGLVDQTAWTRLFEGVFGHTVHTTAAVLAAFMGGLGLGAFLGGRLADRCPAPIRAYAALELGLAVVVWASPTCVRALVGGEGDAGGPWRWLAAFALLLIPTTAMGATLPLLSRAVAGGAGRVVPALGGLLGANTLGAVAGTLAAAFLLIRVLGVSASVGVGAGLSLAAGFGALALSVVVREPPLRLAPPAAAATVAEKRPLGVALVVLGSGFAALAAEVVWVRVFALILGSSLLSFALVLGSLLAAYAAGSLVAPLLRRSVGTLGAVLVGLGVAVAATVLPFRGADWLAASGALAGLLGTFAGRAALAALVVAVPGLLMGTVLPLAGVAVRDDRRVGGDVGLLYLANTAGNVLGALTA